MTIARTLSVARGLWWGRIHVTDHHPTTTWIISTQVVLPRCTHTKFLPTLFDFPVRLQNSLLHTHTHTYTQPHVVKSGGGQV
jgi:hypothetical protein